MNEYYEHVYLTKDTYRVYERNNKEVGFRFIDKPDLYKPYQDWLAAGNVPEKISGDRFISIVNGEVIENPDKDAILAAEQAEKDRIENDKRLRDEIAALDYKTIRYLEQEIMDQEGVIDKKKIKMTKQELVAHLLYKQSLRDQVSDPKIDISIGE